MAIYDLAITELKRALRQANEEDFPAKVAALYLGTGDLSSVYAVIEEYSGSRCKSLRYSMRAQAEFHVGVLSLMKGTSRFRKQMKECLKYAKKSCHFCYEFALAHSELAKRRRRAGHSR